MISNSGDRKKGKKKVKDYTYEVAAIVFLSLGVALGVKFR